MDPDVWANDQQRATAVVHELGHVMGLHHEHQRHDAAAHVKFNCPEVRGYAEAKKIILEKRRLPADSDYFDKMQCTDVDEASAPDDRMTFREFYNYKTVGNFDWKSVMLYTSKSGASRGAVVLEKVEGGGTWGWNYEPSEGDVAAVKLLYPDVTPQGGGRPSKPPK
ncbi:hypothetical protein EJ08DRAFT_681096 [Tothia fuscella]|uniref:Metalloendopeptidase n=1 Tax=Tothia fuscella TaxID=1048955 RepID=A0A9P4NLR2_9PEZI|nr:hypothetical protein EJ08DRAFT_681096 [Tothia fuscella]